MSKEMGNYITNKQETLVGRKSCNMDHQSQIKCSWLRDNQSELLLLLFFLRKIQYLRNLN